MKSKLLLIIFLFFFGTYYISSFGQVLTEQDYSELARLFEEDVQLMGNPKEVYDNYQATRSQDPFSHSRVLTLNGNPNVNICTRVNKIIVIVDMSMYNQLSSKIERYAYDINYVYGCDVIMDIVSGGDHTNIKNLITTNQTNLDGVVFIGDIHAAWFEIANDHDKYGYSVWPCDLYYMALNGIWADLDGNGIYDSHTGNVQPEIFVGRISTANMGTLLSEKNGLESYLDKNHEFWMGHNTVNNKFGLAYTDRDWVNSSQFKMGIQYLYGPITIAYDTISYGDPSFGRTDYLNRLLNNRYEFIQLACHASYYYLYMSGGGIYSDEIFNNGTKAIGYNLYCCSACNWTAVTSNSNQGFLAGSYILNENNSSLVVVGSTKTGSMLNFSAFYTPLGQGKTIGESLKQWWKTIGITHSNSTISWYYGMSIIGDPMVNFYHSMKTILPGNTLTISDTVRFAPNASITVLPGGKLIVDGGTLTNACAGAMWKGITVQGAYTNGIVEVKNGGTIENAVCGIHSTGGGLVRTTDAHFMNNTVSVKIDAVPSVLQGISTTFKNSVFTINDNYLGNPLNFETHIKLSNTYKVTVSGCTFKNEATQKSYQPNYNSGIWSFNAPLTATGYCPSGIINPQTGECQDYIQSEFSGLNVAVSASNSGATPYITVRDSRFTDNLYGVKIDAVDYSKLLKNIFNLTQDNSYGVVVNNSTGYKIEENYFQKRYLNPATNRTVGLTICNSGAPENEVYKNFFTNLYVGQNFLNVNSTQVYSPVTPLTGLQTLCNSFNNSQYRDVYVGYLPGVLAPRPDYSSIRNMQGSMQSPAGNCFSQNLSIHFKNSLTFPVNYYYGLDLCENPVVSGLISKYATNKASSCPSKITNGGNPTKGDGDIEAYLAQYDEWNLEYENWLAQLLATEPNSEEYFIIIDQVSYFSALKDNYFNSIIIAMMAENSPSNFEGVSGEAGRGSLSETLRFLFNYRNHYTDNLSIIETYLAENNFSEALATLASMHEKFEFTEEQMNELTGLQIYVLWLQQLENEGNNIYKLSENELDYLINFVKTNTGRGVVFANNILCGVYGICVEAEKEKGEEEKGNSPSTFEGVSGEAGRGSLSASSACSKELDKITLYPNPGKDYITVISKAENCRFELINATGAVVTSVSLNEGNNTINTSSLNQGVYIYKATINNETTSGKWVKNK